MSRLLVMNKARAVKQLNLPRHGTTTLGRGEQCHVVIESALVSRLHAEIVADAEGVTVRDLGSSNGTFVNGRRVRQQALRHGDVLRLGDSEVRFLATVRLAQATDLLGLVDWQPPKPRAMGLAFA